MYGTSGSPGISGTTGRAPVVIRKRRPSRHAISRRDAPRVEKARLGLDDVDTVLGKDLRCLVLVHALDGLPDVVANAGHIDCRRLSADAVAARRPDFVGDARDLHERLAGHAAGPRAIAADPPGLDEGHAGPQARRELSGRQPA